MLPEVRAESMDHGQLGLPELQDADLLGREEVGAVLISLYGTNEHSEIAMGVKRAEHG